VSTDGSVDLAAQVIEELEEELGVEGARIRSSATLGVIEDLADGVLDIAVLVELNATEGEALTARRSDEYSEIRLIPADAATMILGSWSQLTPTVLPLLRLLDARRGRPGPSGREAPDPALAPD
jgi:8-oxo-dGTP pyrophosphatase MutT (NUDIX family)